MANTFEELLDQSLDARRIRAAGILQAPVRADEDTHAEADEARQKLKMFAGDVYDLMRAAVAQTNRRLAQQAEGWKLRDVSGRFSGPLHEGSFGCNPPANPLAFEAVARGRPLGDTLVVELTPESTVTVSTVASSTCASNWPRRPLGVRDVPFANFTSAHAGEILARYVGMLPSRMSD